MFELSEAPVKANFDKNEMLVRDKTISSILQSEGLSKLRQADTKLLPLEILYSQLSIFSVSTRRSFVYQLVLALLINLTLTLFATSGSTVAKDFEYLQL